MRERDPLPRRPQACVADALVDSQRIFSDLVIHSAPIVSAQAAAFCSRHSGKSIVSRYILSGESDQ
jgi:hypothetical protein